MHLIVQKNSQFVLDYLNTSYITDEDKEIELLAGCKDLCFLDKVINRKHQILR